MLFKALKFLTIIAFVGNLSMAGALPAMAHSTSHDEAAEAAGHGHSATMKSGGSDCHSKTKAPESTNHHGCEGCGCVNCTGTIVKHNCNFQEAPTTSKLEGVKVSFIPSVNEDSTYKPPRLLS